MRSNYGSECNIRINETECTFVFRSVGTSFANFSIGDKLDVELARLKEYKRALKKKLAEVHKEQARVEAR